MLVRLRRFSRAEQKAAGTRLIASGQQHADFLIVLDGAVDVFSLTPDGRRLYESSLRHGQFTGELDLLSSRSACLNAECATDCTVLRIERSALREMMAAEADVANLIMQATMWRRLQFLGDVEGGVAIVGDQWDREVLRLSRFLTQNCYPHQVLSSQSPEGKRLLGENVPTWPSAVLPNGTRLEQPTLPELADALGLAEAPDPQGLYDLIVVGAGPSGLAAAVYGASEGLRTIVIEGGGPGGQAGTSSRIENYLGFPTGVSGEELAYRAQVQAQKFGATLTVACNAVRLERKQSRICVTLSGGAEICAKAVVIATGARYRTLDAENYDDFEGHGIHYAATAMEGNLSRGSSVAVIGGGNSAGQAAVFLATLAKHVHLIIRRNSLRDTMSHYLISRIVASDAITVHTCTEVVRLDGVKDLQEVTLACLLIGVKETPCTENLFVMIGAEPNTGWLYGSLKLTRKGFVCTGGLDGFESSRYATSLRGVFAVGDVRADSVKRVASAVGEGSVVISDVHRYLAATALEDAPSHDGPDAAAMGAFDVLIGTGTAKGANNGTV